MDDKLIQELTIPPDQAEVVQQIDLSSLVNSGKHRLLITDRSERASNYQLTTQYHLPTRDPLESESSLAIDVAYDRSELAVNERVLATAKVVNRSPASLPMLLLDLPIPAGFSADRAEFETLALAGKIAKYQLTPQSVIVYLRELPPTEPCSIAYHLLATMPVKITIPAATAYEYYTPENRCMSKSVPITVRTGE